MDLRREIVGVEGNQMEVIENYNQSNHALMSIPLSRETYLPWKRSITLALGARDKE